MWIWNLSGNLSWTSGGAWKGIATSGKSSGNCGAPFSYHQASNGASAKRIWVFSSLHVKLCGCHYPADQLVAQRHQVELDQGMLRSGKSSPDSNKLNRHQKAYSTIEKEALALVLAVQYFEVYVSSVGSPMVVYSGHNPLAFLLKFQVSNSQVFWWSLILHSPTV